MSKSIIKNCTCTSEFQDKQYGKGRRVHNVVAEGNKASCTVCEGSAKMAKRNHALNRKVGELITSNRKSKSI